jgi:FO synthase subunit 1
MEDEILGEYCLSLLNGTQQLPWDRLRDIRNTYSPTLTYANNIFIPLTHICRNRCGYCAFRRDPSLVLEPVMSEREVMDLVKEGAARGAHEALFTFGEGPEYAPSVQEALSSMGYKTILTYLYHLCGEIVDTSPLLPHINAGVISYHEQRMLREVSASMGLMLETSSDRLMSSVAHKDSPGKRPAQRIQAIRNAGKLKIPFTSGILLGIGETTEEILHSLETLRGLQDRYGHLQEIIIQNFVPHEGTPMGTYEPASSELLIRTIAVTRILFPDCSVQVPPNLAGDVLSDAVRAGANDLGGISLLTEDYINPGHPWPSPSATGFDIVERLPVYPRYVSTEWMSKKLYAKAFSLTRGDGYVG